MGLGVNVLLFAAVLFAFVVVMIAVNRDAPKTTSPFEGRPPPRGGGESAGGGAGFRGTVALGDAVSGKVPSGGILFVIVRQAGMPDRGPPLAVKRVNDPSFPVHFEVGPGDAMMQGVPFSGPFDVYARLDADGNAMTREPEDLVASAPASAVAAGGSAELVLDATGDVQPRAPASAPAAAPAPEPPAAPASAPSAAAPAGGAHSFRGQVRLGASTTAKAGAVLYLIVRAAGMPNQGPPVAAKKIDAPSFPQGFEIGEGDVMMQGVPFSGPFDVYARLDGDGNAMTKEPGDLYSSKPAGGVKGGDAAVEVVLDAKQ